MVNKLEKRVQGQRRSFLPLSNQSINTPSKASPTPPSSSHKRSISAPFGMSRPGHARSRSWLAGLLKPATSVDSPAPAPPPKDPTPPRPASRQLRPSSVGRPLGMVNSNPYAHLAGQENEKPLPPVHRALSPVAEERSFVSPASPISTMSSLPPQRDLQQRLASWDWSSEGGETAQGTFSSNSSSRRTTLNREDEGGYGDEETRGRQEDGPGLFASVSDEQNVPKATSTHLPQPFERVEPESSYLEVAAIPSSSSPAIVNFDNPFSTVPVANSQYLSAVLPSRPPSSLSIASTADPSSSSSRPPLHIDTQPSHSRNDSDVSASVYSRNASVTYSEDDGAPETAGPDPRLRSYFSPITPADVRTPLSGLAISTSPPPASPPRSPLVTRQMSRSSIATKRNSTRPSLGSSTSSHSTARSSRPSPVFDIDIFSHAPSSTRTAATSTFEPSTALLSPRSDAKSPSLAMSRSTSSASMSSGSHQGTWREDWTIDARMSRYFPPQEEAYFEAEEEEDEKENDRPISTEQESRRIQEYCIRELIRRKQERHRRYLDERQALYGEAESDVTFGAAV